MESSERSIESLRESLIQTYQQTRARSLALMDRLSPEEYRIQSREEVSPPWWNLGHTSWFFVRNILEPAGFQISLDQAYDYVLNSYYVSLGSRVPQADRGKLSRPTTQEIFEYRISVDQRVLKFLKEAREETVVRFQKAIWTGIQHEQQHQELFLSEIKHILSQNPIHLRVPYSKKPLPPEGLKSENALGEGKSGEDLPSQFIECEGGDRVWVGADPKHWSWDNELPQHPVLIRPFEIADRTVTNGEYLEFMEDGGYTNPLLWLNNGWAWVEQTWRDLSLAAPLYWSNAEGEWTHWTLHGQQAIRKNDPVVHVSFFEADAFARWKKMRLPTEAEWEYAATLHSGNEDARGSLLSDSQLDEIHPTLTKPFVGSVWEWTSSPYLAYPGYEPFQGPLAEYNGKFMDGQYVLRGGSVATPCDHIRLSYRNFWAPQTQFQFSGIRLARSGKH